MKYKLEGSKCCSFFFTNVVVVSVLTNWTWEESETFVSSVAFKAKQSEQETDNLAKELQMASHVEWVANWTKNIFKMSKNGKQFKGWDFHNYL